MIRIRRVFKPDEKFVYEWNEDYRPWLPSLLIMNII